MRTKPFALWLLCLIPLIYLGYLWTSLPEQVPTHFTAEGPDRWSSRTSLIFMPGLLTPGICLLFLALPYLDPKGKLSQMGSKYTSLRFLLTLFFCLLSCYLLYISSTGTLARPEILTALIGALFIVLGNYFQTVRPNYFLGLRTPWTLEDEEVWKSTHKMGGKLWLGAGILILLLSFTLEKGLLDLAMPVIIIIMVVVPLVYSFVAYQRKKRTRS
jgi:uncharacterized membrane protein